MKLACTHLFLFSALGSGCVFASSIDDLLQPRIALDAQTAKTCPASVLVPFSLAKPCEGSPDHPELRGCSGVWFGVGCQTWNRDGYTGLNFAHYRYNLEHNDYARSLSIGLHKSAFNDFVEKGGRGTLLVSEQDGSLTRSADGLPQIAKEELLGDCEQEQTRKIEVTQITGPNWRGWMFEQSFAAPRKKLKVSCQKFTPTYRCVTLVFGNDKMSAAFPTHCFLRKKVDNLDTELSFDVFMDMVKTIRFNEGSVTVLPTK